MIAVKSPDGDFTNAAADTEVGHDDVILITVGVKDVDRVVTLP